jgi:hypothetical protein
MLGLHLKTDGHDSGRVCWQIQSGRGRTKMTRVSVSKKNARKDDETHVDANAKNKACVYTDSCKRKQTNEAKLRAEHTANCLNTASAHLFTNYYHSRHASLQADKHSVIKDNVSDRQLMSPERHETCLRTRTSSICCPEQFFCDAFRNKIEANRAHANQQWIFDLIRGELAPNEFVFVDEPEWMLVQGNSHVSQEKRYLVIFKDTALHTIRDLRQRHLAMLRAMWLKVSRFVRAHHANHAAFRYYFHYMPSVFQLHLHVCCNVTADVNRTQPLSCVMRNIDTRDTWYRDALIFFSPARATRLNASAPVSANMARLCAHRATDKHDRVCI